MLRSDKKDLSFLFVSFGLVLVGWSLGLFIAPTEAYMGEVYRIIYVHVPMAGTALGVTSVGLLISSLLALVRNNPGNIRSARAWAEVGLVFTCITLISGSIWGKPTWNTYWTWEPRLTTTFILAVLFAGYLLLFTSLPPGRNRDRVCSVLGIMIFADIPIIYYSVSWWRTLHQPASLIEKKGSTMDPEMFSILMFCLISTILFSFALWNIRRTNLTIQDEVDSLGLI